MAICELGQLAIVDFQWSSPKFLISLQRRNPRIAKHCRNQEFLKSFKSQITNINEEIVIVPIRDGSWKE